MTTDDIDVIVVLVQTKEGKAHQILASADSKRLFLKFLADEKAGLTLDRPIKPINFEYE